MDGTRQPTDLTENGENGAEEELPDLTADDVEEIHDQPEGDDEPMDDGDDGEDGDDGDDKMVIHDSSIAAFYGARGESIFTIAMHPKFPSPPLAVSGGSDDTSFIWNVTDGEIVQQLLPKHKDSVTMVGWNADGTLVATGGMDGIINVFACQSPGDWTQWKHLVALEGGDEVQFLTWHPKGNVLAAGYGDCTCWMWQLPKGDVMNVFTGHEDAVTAGRFTPDGRKLMTTSTDGSLIIYDPRQSAPLSKLGSSDSRFASEGGFVCLAISPDSKLAAVGSVTGQARVVSLVGVDQGGGLSVVSALAGHIDGESIEGIAFIDLLANTAGGVGHLVTAATDGKAVVWDLQTKQVRVECVHYDSDENGQDTSDGGALTTLVVHEAGPLFTTASSSGTLRTWDARSGNVLAKHEGFTDGVLDADVKPDGKGGWSVVGAGDEGVALIFKC